jgi:uncharacterized cupredoxin-like copper-binding protein
VKALDKDGEIVKDYAGTIYITVSNDSKATVPHSEGYTFLAADQGQKTFSKGLIFTKEGTAKISVDDFDRIKVKGNASVTVKAGTDGGSTAKEGVTITSPDNNSTLGKPDFQVLGATKKSSKVQLFINGEKNQESQTDETGSFLFQVKPTGQAKNTLVVKVLDGSDKVVGESSSVMVTTGTESGTKTTLTATPATVNAGDTVTLKAMAETGLKSVTVAFGENIITLKEDAQAGSYSATATAPSLGGNYDLSITTKNELGKESTTKNAAKVEVNAPSAKFKNIKTTTGDKEVTFNFMVENDSDAIAKFEFTTTSSSGGITKSVTPNKTTLRNMEGGYTWKISSLNPDTYTFAIAAANVIGLVDTKIQSEAIPVDLSLGAGGKCNIGNIANFQVQKHDDSSVLSWDMIPEAVSYNIYKKTTSGEYVLIDTTKANTYTIHIASGPIKYEDFTVKGVCADMTQSVDYAPATKVQTGPEKTLAVILVISLLGAFVLMRRRLNS